MKSVKSKKTSYNGIPFRSKLEAQWAVFFDHLKIEYQYEPEWDEVEFGGFLFPYKPDFYLTKLDLWCEVKRHGPRHLTDGELRKIVGWAKEYQAILVLAGRPSIPRETDDLENSTKAHYWYSCHPAKKKVIGPVPNMWWCECPKCGKIDIRPFGGNPVDCDDICFSNPPKDLFGEELPIPDGHKSNRLKEACRIAKEFNF
jgi:hypothetical protein